MGYDIETLWWCPTTFARYAVLSSDGETVYGVTIEGERGHCTCPGFKHRESCRHMTRVWDEACLYNPQWHDPGPDTMQPAEFVHASDAVGPDCPGCGRAMIGVRCAV